MAVAVGHTVVSFTWEPFLDAESGIARVAVCVGNGNGTGTGTGVGAEDNVVAWAAVPGQPGAVQVLLPTQAEGSVMFAGVRAWNGVGLVGEAWSDGVRLTCEPGTAGCTYDGTFLCLGT